MGWVESAKADLVLFQPRFQPPGVMGMSSVDVPNISQHGFWLLMGTREMFLPFREFPWFKDASVASILNVELLGAQHLYWPDLDVDLAVESIEHPERYPLVSKIAPEQSLPS